MSAARRLRSVAAPDQALFATRADWAHPHNERHAKRYVAAVAYLRRNRPSQWVMDRNSRAPGWRTNPPE